MNFIIDRGRGERERLWISGLESNIFAGQRALMKSSRNRSFAARRME
jgi:hypothetical protein